jgi:sarcosine oxidase subunit alpha
MVAGVYDHGYVSPMSVCGPCAAGRRAAPPALAGARGQVVSAIGAIERPLSFAGNDKPG